MIYKKIPSFKLYLILSFSMITVGLGSISALFVKTKLTNEIEQRVTKDIQRISDEFAIVLNKSINDKFTILQNLSNVNEFQKGVVSNSKLNDALLKIKTVEPRFAWLGYANLDGKLLASTIPSFTESDVSTTQWFLNGKIGFFLSDVYESNIIKKYVAEKETRPFKIIDIAIPVRDSNGNVTGVLAARLSWDWIVDIEAEMLASSSVSNNGVYLFILNGEGRAILAPDEFIGSLVLPTMELSLKQTGYEYLTINEEDYLIGYTKSQNGLSWTLVAAQEKDKAFQSLSIANWELFTVNIVGCILGIWLSIWLSYRLTAPLDKLLLDIQFIIQKIEDANTDINIQHDEVQGDRSYREIAKLSDAFNSSIKAIATSVFKVKYYESVIQHQINSTQDDQKSSNH